MSSTTIYSNKAARIAQSGGLEMGAGASDFLPVGLYSGYLYRALIAFSYSFTGWTSISAATLHLRTSTQFYVAFGSDPDILVRRLTESWSEGSSDSLSSSNAVTWANQPSATTSGQVTLDVSTSEQDWVSVDITSIMQAALAAGVFHGLKVYADDEGSSSDVTEFYSDDTSSKPYITITYSTNTAPNAPTSLSPTADAIRNTLTPTFTGTFSDPDSGDTLSGVQIRVYEDNGTTLKWDSGTLTASSTSFSKQYTGAALTGNTFYKWQARTKDNSGAWGAYSSLQRFKVNSTPTAPTTSTSGSSSDLTTLTPALYVTHNDADATDQLMSAYHVIVYRSSDSTVMWDTGDANVTPTHVATINYAGAALSWQTSYYFIARTKDSNGAWSPYSSPRTFTTHTTLAPDRLAPASSNIASSLTPTLTGSRGSSNDLLTSAQIEVYASDGTTLVWDSGTFTSGVTSSGFTKTYSGTALTPAATYKWRARVTSSVGGTSAWSTLQTFLAPDTNTPTLISPLGPGIADLTPDLQWSRTASFTYHQLEVYDADVSVIWSDNQGPYASATSKTVTYAGPTLVYGEVYYWRVRVSTDGTNWSPWGGLVLFQTGVAGIPTLSTPTDGSWETGVTPFFSGTTADSEDLQSFRIFVYASDQTTLVWDSGDIAGTGTSWSTFGTSLTKGEQYFWQASYIKDGDIPGGLSPLQSFHINADPSAPTGLSPTSGQIVDSVAPTFSATFSDPDIADWGDTPTELTVEVYRVSDGVLMHTLTDSTDLVAGQNSVARTSEGTALSMEVEYMYRARYTDSKSADGAWSQYTTFKPSEPPVATLTAPVTSITAPGFAVTWTYSSPGSKPQAKWQVVVVRSSDEVVIYDTGEVTGTDTSWSMPSGYLLNGETYDINLTLWDTDSLTATDTEAVLADWAAPAALASFSASPNPASSEVVLSWEASALTAEDFSFYEVYRRELGEDAFTPYDTIVNQATTQYIDQLAANGVVYDYKVSQFQHVPGDVDLESEDNAIASAVLDVDVWFVIGADGSSDHSFELPVYQESHQKPVQQEIFEPLGGNRKKTARGNVLGYEGTMDMTFTSDERVDAVRRLTYLAENAGPHILKSPFGDVWSVEFAGPVYKYAPGGHMTVTLAWIEVA